MEGKCNRYDLKQIYDTLVSVCNAIVSVINVDITIVDSELNRITGTGRYVMSIGEQLSKNCVFAYALDKGEKFIIENPREHEACNKCENKEECKEWAQVCCPIKVENSIVGIMGLIAFNKTQKYKIAENKENLLEFLSRMADLIAAKLTEEKKNQKVSLMARELEVLVNSMDMGVISTDENGIIQRYNTIAQEMFGIDESLKSIGDIHALKESISFQELRKSGKHIYNKEFEYTAKGGSCSKCRGIYSSKPIEINEAVTGYVFTFNKLNEIIKVVNDVASSNLVISFNDIIGEGQEIKAVKDYAAKIAGSSSTVMIQGESGTGKELFARAIHYSSDRRSNPFVAINCTAIPENLIESELFGYEEGAFTGAKKGGKLGKFELANRGTILLDEIGDMPLNLQAKLLRVLQEGKIERVGGNTVIPVKVRIIAASNKSLEEKVRDKEFREDLFYRLNVIPVFLPPLRSRIEDVELLAETFLEKYNMKLGKKIPGIDAAVVQLFKTYQWPGNVRELENVVEYAVNMCNESVLTLKDLPRRLKEAEAVQPICRQTEITKIAELEMLEIKKAVSKYGSSSEGIEKAAKQLGISRATMYRKLKEYRINNLLC